MVGVDMNIDEEHQLVQLKSIDGLFAQDHIRSYVFSDTPDVLKKTDQYDGEIVRINTDNRFIANEKYRMGAYSTKLIAFDPFNCKYAVFNRNAFDDEDGSTSGAFSVLVYQLIK